MKTTKKRYASRKRELTEEEKLELARFVEKINNLVASEHQEAIFERARTGNGRYVINAGPGSGKTTTAIKASTWFQGSAISFSFNKKIQIDSDRKLKALGSRMVASTLHSFGLQCIARFIEQQGGKVRVEENKYEKLIDDHIVWKWEAFLFSIQDYLDEQEEEVNLATLRFDANVWSKMLVHYCQVALLEPTEKHLLHLVDQFDLNDIDTFSPIWPFVCNAVQTAIEAGKVLFQEDYIINLDDMIYYPNIYPQIPVRTYDHIILDEAQDASRAAQGLLYRACHNTTQVFAIGDVKQSIYAFAGADHNSIPNLIKMLNAEVLPLRVCYRCGTNIIDLANQLDGQIIPAPNMPEGMVSVIARTIYLESLQAGDAVIGRTTAKLVEDCLKVLQTGKLASVLGKKIGESIAAIVKRVEEKRIKRGVSSLKKDLSNFIELVEEHQRLQEQAIKESKRKNRDLALSELKDKVDTVRAFFTAYITKCIDPNSRLDTDPECSFNKTALDFRDYIMGLFTEDEAKNRIQFMTAHRSKGLEFKRVFIIGTNEFPHPKAKGEKQRQQEENLMYVAITRAIDELYFLEAPFDAVRISKPEEEEPAATQASVHIFVEETLTVVAAGSSLQLPAEETHQRQELRLVEASSTQHPEEVQQPERMLMASHTEEIKTKHAGGRPRKDRVRINIKLDSDLAEHTQGIDRSELINILLRKHFDEQG